MAVGTNSTVRVALTPDVWVEVLDGTLFSGGTVYMDSGLPLKIAIATALPAPSLVDWIPLGLRVDPKVALVVELNDNVYAMPVSGDVALYARVLRVSR